MTNRLEADYLVVGAGGMGMAFTDTILTETDATVIIVDRHHQPGGHWTTAYPFVRLHQPSAFYGVNSRPLGSDQIDRVGWNAGLYELATSGEVCAYFDQVMQQRFLPSGRVSYFPKCEYQGESRFRSFAGADYTVNVRRRTVDATYMHVTVPSMRSPPYEVASGVVCVPVNELAKQAKRHERYVVVGAGKTGMDACLWLLKQDIDPTDIVWIMPRDSWMLDRSHMQPGPDFRDSIQAGRKMIAEAVAAATSIDDLFARLDATGGLLRLDALVQPTMYRCATVTEPEVEQLRRIGNIVRLGRVRAIEADSIVLDHGAIPTGPGTLHVDCTADGLEKRPALPVFDGCRITLQAVRRCQQVFSAAFIAHVEASYADDAAKNELCMPVPHPDTDMDWLQSLIDTNRNHLRWAEDARLQTWLDDARLDGYRHSRQRWPSDPAEQAKALEAMRRSVTAMNEKLEQLLRSGDTALR